MFLFVNTAMFWVCKTITAWQRACRWQRIFSRIYLQALEARRYRESKRRTRRTEKAKSAAAEKRILEYLPVGDFVRCSARVSYLRGLLRLEVVGGHCLYDCELDSFHPACLMSADLYSTLANGFAIHVTMQFTLSFIAFDFISTRIS